MKVVFVCPQDGYIDVTKVPGKTGLKREKTCPICTDNMNFIRKNKKKYKDLFKKQENNKP